ncbi:hypothetical protein IWX50DRAFT_648937 [Phyllosticta citricarpa]
MLRSILTSSTLLPETLALVAGSSCPAALIIVLAAYDGKEIFDYHSITLNTWFSALSSASKAVLAFALATSISQFA